MPRSEASYHSLAPSRGENEEDDEVNSSRGRSIPPSPNAARKYSFSKTSDLDLRSRLPPRLVVDEYADLLDNSDGRPSYRSMPPSPRHQFKRQHSNASIRRNHSRHGSFGFRVARALGAEPNALDSMLPTPTRRPFKDS